LVDPKPIIYLLTLLFFPGKLHIVVGSVADPGCLSRIQIFPSRTAPCKKAPEFGSGSATKNLSIFNPKNCYQAFGNMIRNVYPGSGIFSIPDADPGSRGQKNESRIPVQEALRALPVKDILWTVEDEVPGDEGGGECVGE
jgi:hypothetical protein